MENARKEDEPPEIITDPDRITTILQNMHGGRCILSVTFPRPGYGNDRGDSLIVEVNKNKKFILINKLISEQAHQRFLKEKRMKIRSFFSGIHIRFDAHLEILINEDGDLYYQIEQPNQLIYYQKRTAHRATTSNETPVPVTIQLEDGSYLDGMIEDISIGGVSITFTNDLPHSLQVGYLISACHFTIPDNEGIICQLNIRFIKHKHETTSPKIGASFESLPQPVHRQITQFVMALDRERRRTSIK